MSPTPSIRSAGWIIVLFLALTGCFPSMSTGPEPHSIPYDAALFHQLADEIVQLDIDSRSPSYKMSLLMQEMGMMSYRDHGEVKLFFCGYGVVGKGWGFAYGSFSDAEIEYPGSVQRNGEYLGLAYLEKLDNNWYRFGAG